MKRLAPAALAAALCLAALAAAPLAAQSGPSADEVMDKVYGSPRPKGSVLTMTMVISKGGQKLSRTLTTWAKGDNAKGETEMTVMKFLAPADVKGSGFLNLKKADGSSESMIWLPALARVRRLGGGSSDQDQAFFGSDFTNRDINGFVKADFDYVLAGSESGAYSIEAKPRKKGFGYEKLVYRIDSAIWKYVKIEYWRGGKVAKTQTVAYDKIGDYYMPTRIVMASASGSATDLAFTGYKLDQELGDQLFTERFLKQ
jgi:hypothetical protein